MNYPALLSFFCGFVSLSLEILWVRLYGFAMLSTPVAFGFVLMAYLTGIAIGAWWGGKFCREDSDDLLLWRCSMVALVASAVLTMVIPFVFAWGRNQSWRNPYFDFLLISFVSCMLAYVFPIAHHLGAGTSGGQQGKRFAWVYTSNVMGAALGPLMTGYVLLNFFTLQQAFAFLVILQFFAAAFFCWKKKAGDNRLLVFFGCCALIVVGVWFDGEKDPHDLIQKINSNHHVASRVIENRHGIITIFSFGGKGSEKSDHAIYGGNVYDGRTNMSLEKNTNGLHRPLLLAALHEKPKKVLVLGLSIGSWLALINGFPGVEHVDVVEINDGYLRAVEEYPAQANALRDPRVNVVIDDARRWLRLHPENYYDVIVMNTTWHWRANAGFLLSQEFLWIIKKHLNPGGVVAFNATGSPDAFFTASHVFLHAYRYDNFIYAADFDFRSRKDSGGAKEIYSSIKVGDEKIFKDGKLIDRFLEMPFVSIAQDAESAGHSLEVITDNNGLTEYKYGYSLGRLY